jgi:SAM-dependent methyltransferase
MQSATVIQPDIHGTLRDLWDQRAATYAAETGHGKLSAREERAWRQALVTLCSRLQPHHELSVLDVGTGTGVMARLLAGMGHHVTGVDLSPAMLGAAREAGGELGPLVTYVEARADRLPFADDSFDLVFSRHLLWTLPRPRKTIQEWARVTRPGGVVAAADGWWEEPGAAMQSRRALGAALRAMLERPSPSRAAYKPILQRLPLSHGLSPYSVRHYFDQAGLTRIVVKDLSAVRAAERYTMPPWRWIDQARFTWIASGIVPE